MVNDVRPPRIRPPPGSYRLTDVNNLGIIVKSNVATVENLFTSRRNRLFTSSESALHGGEIDRRVKHDRFVNFTATKWI